MGNNPYRTEMIETFKKDLAEGKKYPTPTMGVSPTWIWYSKTWLFSDKGFQERLAHAFIPSMVFDNLEGGRWISGCGMGFSSKESAMAAMKAAFEIVIKEDDMTFAYDVNKKVKVTTEFFVVDKFRKNAVNYYKLKSKDGLEITVSEEYLNGDV